MDNSVGIGANPQPGAQSEPFFDLLRSSSYTANPPQNSTKKMENSLDSCDSGGVDNILPSFQFQPIRPPTFPLPRTGNTAVGVPEEAGSLQSAPSSYSSHDSMVRSRHRESASTYESTLPRNHDPEKESLETSTVAAVERTMKKYADNLLRVLEGLNGRLSLLESNTQRLEVVCGEIMTVTVNSQAETDGRLRSLENHILEVQRGLQLLRDRQELAEAQSQLAKLQAAAKIELAPPSSVPSAPTPVPDQLPELTRANSGKGLPEMAGLHVGNIVSSSHYQPQQVQIPLSTHSQTPQSQGPQQQQQASLPPPLQQQQAPEILHQQPAPPPMPSQQITHSPQPPPPQMSMQSYYGQQQQPPSQQPPPPPSLQPYSHQQEATPVYGQHPQIPQGHHVPPPAQSYPPDLPSYHPASYGLPGPVPQSSRPPGQGPPGSHIPVQPSVYDSSISRSGSGQLALPPPYLPQAQQVSSSTMYDPQSPVGGYPSASYRVAQPVPSAPAGGGSGYPRLPVAQPLTHALPGGGGGGGHSSTSSNRSPVEEVFEKTVQMGFSRDLVRVVIKRLSDSGERVELNTVLDKLTNGGDLQPKGWFNR